MKKKLLLALLFITTSLSAQTNSLIGDYFSKPLWARSSTYRIGLLSSADTLLISNPFILGATKVTTTGTQLNYLAGSGFTSGYLPYFNGTKLTNSGIYTDGINYGIGTTALGALLHVQGDAGLRVAGTTGTTNIFGRQLRFDGAADILTTSAMNLTLGTNNAANVTIQSNGNVGIGTTAPTAVLHLKAGTATASTAPLKFTSGALNTTAEAGAVEFLTDAFYGTITTGAARKTFAFLESPTFTGTVTAPTIVSTTVMRLKNYTVATLPAGTQGDIAFVTDALAPTFLGTLTGGGAVVTPVFYNGTAWVSY